MDRARNEKNVDNWNGICGPIGRVWLGRAGGVKEGTVSLVSWPVQNLF